MNAAYLFWGFKIDDAPWDDDADDYFRERVGEDSGCKILSIACGDDVDYYLASTTGFHETHNWCPKIVSTEPWVDAEALGYVQLNDACEKLGIACRECALILVSEAYSST